MSTTYLTLRTSHGPNESYLQAFLDNLFREFIEELNYYEKASIRIDNDYKVWDYGEIAMVTYLTHALRRIDPEYKRFIFMQEVGLENEFRRSQGRTDLILQDLENNTATIVEAKQHFDETSKVVDSKSWSYEKAKQEYDKIMNQCKRYYETEKSNLESFNKIYCLSVVFNSVHFCENDIYFDRWERYTKLFERDEYYYFFSDPDNKFGLAIYGTYQCMERSSPSV